MEHLSIFNRLATKGKRGKKTIATVAMIPDADVSALNTSVAVLAGDKTPYCGAISTTHDAMKTVEVWSRDHITVRPALDVAFDKVVLVLPFRDVVARRGGEA